MFGIGLEPTGSKDPFGLRRAANGIVKILAESGLLLRISDLLAVEDGKLSAFFRERVEFYLRDVRGFAYGVVNAVLAPGFDDVRDAIARAEALTAVRGSEDFIAISAAFKRIKNILRQANVDSHSTIDPDKLVELAERSLYDHMNLLMLKIHPIRTDGYGDALEQIATLRPHVDLFFDKVMVMAEDPAIRANRLALIANVLGSFSSIADFSEVVTS
jgi:glycyl-tRNA synthetase beta chain